MLGIEAENSGEILLESAIAAQRLSYFPQKTQGKGKKADN